MASWCGILAMTNDDGAHRGPPKKKAKKTKTTESSIVPFEDDAPAARMSFPPPSNSLEITSKPKKKDKQSSSSPIPSKSLGTTFKRKGKSCNSNSGSKRSRSGSNQPEPLSIELPKADGPPVKQRTKRKKEPTKKQTAIPMAPLDNPAMGTRSKRMDPGSPAMSTRSKRKLSI